MNDLYSDPTYKELAELAQLRQNDLSISCTRIASRALLLSRMALIFRVVIIFLGALVAAQGITDQLMIEHPAIKDFKMIIDVLLALFGIIITVAAGIEAAFKCERRGAMLNVLATKCQSYSRQFMSDFSISENPNDTKGTIDAIKKLLKLQDEKLAEIQQETAELGLNLINTVGVDYSKFRGDTGGDPTRTNRNQATPHGSKIHADASA